MHFLSQCQLKSVPYPSSESIYLLSILTLLVHQDFCSHNCYQRIFCSSLCSIVGIINLNFIAVSTQIDKVSLCHILCIVMYVRFVQVQCLYALFRYTVCTVQVQCLYALFRYSVCMHCSGTVFVCTVQVHCLYTLFRYTVCTVQVQCLYALFRYRLCMHCSGTVFVCTVQVHFVCTVQVHCLYALFHFPQFESLNKFQFCKLCT